MNELLEGMTAAGPVFLTVGAILLLFGKRLYWLAMAGLGFLLGLQLAYKYLAVDAQLQLVVAAGVGVAGAIFAVLAQKIAIKVGGFGIGAVAAYYLAQPYAEALAYQIWLVAAVGALLGISFATFVFKAALVVVSSLVGALLVTQGLSLEPAKENWVFLGLAAAGILVQSMTGRKAPKAD